MDAYDVQIDTNAINQRSSFNRQVAELTTLLLACCGQTSNPEKSYNLFMDQYKNNLNSFQNGLRKMLNDCNLSPEDAAEDIGLERKSIYRWLTTKHFRFPKKVHIDALLVRCNYTLITIQDGNEIYYLFTSKNSPSQEIQSDIHLLLRRLDDKRLDAIRTFMLLAPEISDPTLDIMIRYINDIAKIESIKTITRIG